MDINYILGREQISLHNASVASSGPARIAHAGLAAAYGALLTSSTFPHRHAPPTGGKGGLPNDRVAGNVQGKRAG